MLWKICPFFLLKKSPAFIFPSEIFIKIYMNWRRASLARVGLPNKNFSGGSKARAVWKIYVQNNLKEDV